MTFRVTDWPIRRKLALLVGAGVALALLLAYAAMIARDLRMIRSEKFNQIAALADILGSNATTALEFHDPDTAQEVLSSLRLLPSIETAALFDSRGDQLASYPPATRPLPQCPPPTRAGFTDDGYLAIAADIYRDDDKVGTVYLRSNLDEIGHQVAGMLWITAVVMFVSLAVAMLATSRLQRLFTAPIDELAEAMERVSAGGETALHVQARGRDELGILCDGFNHMVDQIQAARADLEQANDELEERVVERTAKLEREIAERKRTESELAKARDQAESANRTKSEFLANMSHEIRTPMGAILGFSELLTETALSTDQAEAVTTIRRNGEYLLEVINDILDISKIEAGKLDVEQVPCSPCQVLSDVVSLMRVRADSKNLALELAYDGPIPELIRSDPTRLRQILINLAGNAIKFTEVGKVRLVARLIDQASAAPKMQVEVIDSGIGMTEEQMSRLFQPFSQVDTSASRKHSGTGLGLVISRRLAAKLGGDITVRSVAGHGSTLTITVATGPLDGVRLLDNPAEAQLSSGSPKKPAVALPRIECRILLAEDGPDNQRLISLVLKKAGAEVTLAANGQIACDLALAARNEGNPFDVILMDMQMPVMDGYRATELLRQAGYSGPIFALTAHSMSTDRDRCLNAGCDDFVTKPIDRHRLLSLIAECNSRQTADAGSSAANL